MARERKASFFRELEKLDEMSDEENETKTLKIAQEKPTSRLNLTKTLVTGSPDSVKVGAPSAPKPKINDTTPAPITVVKETPFSNLNKKSGGNLQYPIENSPSNRPGIREARIVDKKKKRSSSLREIPEAQQIFKGLVFC